MSRIRLAGSPAGSVTSEASPTRYRHQVQAARRFLAADERHDPLDLPGARAACEAILRHVAAGSQIVVHGDYDVDGVCSTALLVRALRRLGADPGWHLPSRVDDGYGLSLATAVLDWCDRALSTLSPSTPTTDPEEFL